MTWRTSTYPSSLSAKVDLDSFISALAYCSSIAALQVYMDSVAIDKEQQYQHNKNQSPGWLEKVRVNIATQENKYHQEHDIHSWQCLFRCPGTAFRNLVIHRYLNLKQSQCLDHRNVPFVSVVCITTGNCQYNNVYWLTVTHVVS